MKTKDIDMSALTVGIGTLAKMLGVHERTLRIYDKAGILSPKRAKSNRRRYTIDDIEKAKLILFLTQDLSFNLVAIKIFLQFLKKSKIEPKEYYNFVYGLANCALISETEKNADLVIHKKRGRKASKDNCY